MNVSREERQRPLILPTPPAWLVRSAARVCGLASRPPRSMLPTSRAGSARSRLATATPARSRAGVGSRVGATTHSACSGMVRRPTAASQSMFQGSRVESVGSPQAPTTLARLRPDGGVNCWDARTTVGPLATIPIGSLTPVDVVGLTSGVVASPRVAGALALSRFGAKSSAGARTPANS